MTVIDVRADDPKPPAAPVAANSVITVPGVPPLVFLADSATSKSVVKWRVKEPLNAEFRQYDRALLILNPLPGVKYKVTLTTYGDDPLVDSDSEEYTVPPKVECPPVVPVPVPVPPAPPAPAAADPLGMTAATRAIVAAKAWDDASARYRRDTVGGAFAARATAAGAAATLQDAITAAGKGIKGAIEPAVWPSWNQALVAPIQAKLADLVANRRINTPADLAEALAEVATALQGD